ncbi:hypothetical protein CHARACLAT_030551 [Characodon lateralis]|uniref:Uncharacterized protein n=1 Tax=Characodon lateralis TaxID=208331 RepID=A0ABU7EFJ5_9TELE|nr:hypothetical protein [Characodon lateralis]
MGMFSADISYLFCSAAEGGAKQQLRDISRKHWLHLPSSVNTCKCVRREEETGSFEDLSEATRTVYSRTDCDCVIMLEQLGMIGTIRDEDLSPEEPDTESDPEEEPIILNRKKKFGGHRSTDFNCEFEFGERDNLNLDDDWAMSDILKQLKKKRTVTTLDQKIEKIRKKRKAEEKLSQSCEPEGSSEMKEEEEGEEDPAERKEEDKDEEEEDGDEEEFGSSDEEVLTKSGLSPLEGPGSTEGFSSAVLEDVFVNRTSAKSQKSTHRKP